MVTFQGLKIPKWVCETHLRELEDLIESGEPSYARDTLRDGKQDWRDWCVDCAAL